VSPGELDRRTFLKVTSTAAAGALVTSGAAGAAPRPPRGVQPFPLADVTLLDSPYKANMGRTMAYLLFIDLDRLLHTFRTNVGLPSSAQPVGGWESPTTELRGHTMGHLLTAYAQVFANTGDARFKERGDYLVAELAKCQAAASSPGYLSAFPESFIDKVESDPPIWAPYYTVHKIYQGLLDQHELCGNQEALEVLLRVADWCHARNSRLTHAQRQLMLRTEFGGMNELFANLYLLTGDDKHLDLARMFDHEVIYEPLLAGEDRLAGYHANTQIPKIIGALQEYHATGDHRYRRIAETFWNIVIDHHTYVNGGNSNAEWFHSPDRMSLHLSNNTTETCNTYNMLKLSRLLFFLNPRRAEYMDYYEWALINQILGQQNPNAERGYYHYFVPLRPGGMKTYSNDYDNFTCDHGTGMESHTKFADSIYFHDRDTLYVNLFIPSRLDWPGRLALRQETSYPAEPGTRLVVERGGRAEVRIRVPGWLQDRARVTINGRPQQVHARQGRYLELPRRSWREGDTIELALPMRLKLEEAPDDSSVQAVTYGPVLLSGAYGTTQPSQLPALDAASLTQDGSDPLTFTARADGADVTLIPFYRMHGQRYTVYWRVGEPAPAPEPPELVVWYRFDETHPFGYTAADSSGRPDVELTAGLNGPGNSPACTSGPGVSGSAVVMDGSGGYALLPVAILADLREVTVASWVKLDSRAPGARIFDFGSGTNSTYMFLTPELDGAMRFAITTRGPGAEQRLEAPPLPVGEWKHVAVTLAGPAGGARLYVDGTEVAHSPGVTHVPSDLGNTGSFLHPGSTLYNRIGRSLFGNDPYLAGAVDDFRIFGRALPAERIRELSEQR
jgi:DUF1680 family protein